MTKDNKFSFLQQRGNEQTQPSSSESVSSALSETEDTLPLNQASPNTNQPTPGAPASGIENQSHTRKMGRPKGKRSNPDYEQVTTYIRRDTHTAIKVLLLKDKGGGDFSELVQNLLEEYLKIQTFKHPKV
jgi:hypothetical protein